MAKTINKEKTVKGLSYIPFVLLILLAVALLGFGVMAFIYSIVSYIAFESAMIFLILFGSFILLTGFGLLSFEGFRLYKKFFDGKYKQCAQVEAESEPTASTIIEKKKFTLSFQHICFCVLIVGSIFILISAGLGSITPDKWRQELGEYRVEKGYHGQVSYRHLQYNVSDENPIDKISIDVKDKNVAVIYTNDNCVTVSGYEKYPHQLIIVNNENALNIVEGNKPSLENDTTAKMLFFLFEENQIEEQIKVYIPLSMKDDIEIVGDYILAQE